MMALLMLTAPTPRARMRLTLFAFAGVVLVLRPNFATAGWGVLFPLLGATGMAVTIIANRKVHGRASILAMQFYMSVTAMMFLAVATTAGHFSGLENFRLHWPDWTIVARCVFIGLSATLAQWLIFMGTVKAGAGTVAPMTYGPLLMATARGATFFGDWPDVTAILGAAVIVGAGLFLWWRGRAPEPAKTDL
jgi:drug/metabolite transporter (DMT)-like permease